MTSILAGLGGGLVATLLMTIATATMGDGGPPSTAGLVAKLRGGTPEEMRAIGGGDFSVFDDEEFVLLQYARAVESGTVTDRIHDALTRRYSSAEIVALGLLVDFYVGLCNYIAAVDLPFEGGEFVGWAPDDGTVSELFE